ncbi:MAG TPA: alpha/beta hydrolase [Pseudonocardiaceae bacterium]|jgi:pimeloyl-ACP methyl ester carboxylesterase|nr:alpha/beta hydrolase [Pseudonocardiaceae bacterium]
MSTVTSADGTTIDYERYGAGPAVIFIGGALQYRAIDPTTTTTAQELAAEGFTTIDYDRRGRGRSGDTAPYTLDREVEDVAALIDAVGGSATLCTSSSGAAIALAAAQFGLGVTRLALYEPPFFAGLDLSEHVDAMRALLAEGRHEDIVRHNLTKVIGLPEQMVDGMAQSPSWAGFVSVAPTIIYDVANSGDVNTDQDWKSRWADVIVPTVVFSGDQTFPGMPEAADATAAALSNATRRIIAGEGHGPSTAGILPPLLEFLRS